MLPRRSHNIVRCESPQRCCFLGDEGSAPCQRDATVEIVDGDPRESTYVCEEHRGAFAGQAWPVGSG